MVFCATTSPCASNDRMPVVAILEMMLPLIAPDDVFQPDAVAAAAGDLAIGDPDIASVQAVHQPAPGRQRNAGAVEHEAAEADAAAAFAEQQRRSAAAEHQLARAAHADQLRAAGQFQHAAAIDARRQRQRHLRARRIVDGALQRPGLVVGTVGPHAILGDVASEARRPVAPRARRSLAASAPATPAPVTFSKWRRLTSMAWLRRTGSGGVRIDGVTQKCRCRRGARGRGGAIVGGRVNQPAVLCAL